MPDSLPEPFLFQVGAACADITPPAGASLAGYFHPRFATTIRDPLKARALVIGNGEERLALVSLDLATITAAVADPAKALIAEQTGISADHVLICSTHTHTGPEIRSNSVVPETEGYADQLPPKIAGAVQAAVEKAAPATLSVGSTDVHGYSFNRLYRRADGSEVFGRRAEGAPVIGDAGPIDPQLQVLRAVNEQGCAVAFAVHFALHPDVIGGGTADFVSADWPGILCDTLQQVYGEDADALFLQGTCGDINHHPHDPTHLPTRGPAKSTQIGRALAGAAMVAGERAEPMSSGEIGATLLRLPIPYYTRDERLWAEIEQLRAKPERTDMEQYLIQRAETWPHDHRSVEAPIQVFRIGDLGIVQLPAEIFVRLGLEIKHYSPAPHTFVVELANDRVTTYVPTTDQAERGAYGAKPILSRWLCADAGQRMVDASLSLLHGMW